MDKYYLKADFQKEKQEVTKEEFIQAERAAGFRPKYGDGVATGGFSGGGVSGYIEHVKEQIETKTYGKAQQFNTEAELHERITGHKSVHIK